MQNLMLLKALHGLATALLIGGALAVVYRWARGWRAGDPAALGQTLQRPWLFAWLAMGLSLLVFPVSGWWMVHDTGWSLGQTWLLSGSVLYTVGILCWLLLLWRVNRLRQAGQAVSAGQRRTVLGLSIVGGVILVAALGVMVLKPV
ncbi:DUF2269 family protein [Pseudomonas sp. HR96]|uniref:DUF2269 family protein n=1 Tax=Pseudomonas sp. HR96 TaxID=1027966 RepID=UPI002A75697B|nr:DUF2269 family protein [Pseudomonas sp. HR96]WPP00159.1 DUF2269 family protein [Pseudomonas sp. HR96]